MSLTKQNVKKITTENRITYHDFDPDGTTAVDVAWVDGRDVRNWLFTVIRTVGTSALTMKILANSESDGSGTDVEVCEKNFTVNGQPDAFLDYAMIEVQAEEIRKACEDAGEDGRYVSVSLAAATGTDECIVVYHGVANRFPREDLTADSIAT